MQQVAARKLPDPFPLLRNRVWPRETNMGGSYAPNVSSLSGLQVVSRTQTPVFRARVWLRETSLQGGIGAYKLPNPGNGPILLLHYL